MFFTPVRPVAPRVYINTGSDIAFRGLRAGRIKQTFVNFNNAEVHRINTVSLSNQNLSTDDMMTHVAPGRTLCRNYQPG